MKNIEISVVSSYNEDFCKKEQTKKSHENCTIADDDSKFIIQKSNSLYIYKLVQKVLGSNLADISEFFSKFGHAQTGTLSA